MIRHQKSQNYIVAQRLGIALALTAALYFVQGNNSPSLHSIPGRELSFTGG
jgi:hypothetical protein